MSHEPEKSKKPSLSERLLIPRQKTQEFQLKEPGAGVIGVPKDNPTLEQALDFDETEDHKKRHEMMGILYISAACLMFAGLGIGFHLEETWWSRSVQGFVDLNGVGPILLGLFALYSGMRRLSGHSVFAFERQVLCFPILYFSALTLLSSFVGPSQQNSGPGGIFGNYLFWYMKPVFGTGGTQILLCAVILIAFMNVTQIYVSDVLRRVSDLGKTATKAVQWLLVKAHSALVILISDLILILERGFSSFRTHVFEPVLRRTLHGTLHDKDLVAPESLQTPELVSEEYFLPIDTTPCFPTIPPFEKVTKPAQAAVKAKADEPALAPILTPAPAIVPIKESQTLYSEPEEAFLDEDEEDESVVELRKLTQAMMVDTELFEAETVLKPQPTVYAVSQQITEELWPEPPRADFLTRPPKDLQGDSEEDLWERGAQLIKALDQYKVNVALESFTQGPTITRFELKPAAGTKLSRISGLINEITMNLEAKSVRIEAPIPGTNKVGVEIPNSKALPVYFSEMVTHITGYGKEDLHPLTVAFGKNIAGEPVIGNLARMPHLLVAGSTGSGKSVCVNTIISSILFRARPDQVKFVMIDPKQVELAVYRNIPHLITDVVTNPEHASAALKWGVDEMERRYTLLSHFGMRHIDNFNQKVKDGTLVAIEDGVEMPTETLPYVVLIVDELADLMMVAKKDVETSICRIAQKARAVGMHLVIATQRPSVDVITGLIKANLPSRIAFMVKSAIDSRTILDQIGAENLLGRGDMLYYPGGQPRPERVQGAFMNDDEVAELVIRIREIYGDANYQDIVSAYLQSEESEMEDDSEFSDDKYNMALEIAVKEGYVSTSMLQRHLGIGYNRAARIVDVMFARGLCGQQESGKKRKVLFSLAEMEQHFM